MSLPHIGGTDASESSRGMGGGMKSWKVQIASLPDKEKVVAEIYYAGELFAEISQEGDSPLLEIYHPKARKSWQLDLDAVLRILTSARAHLIDGTPM